MSTAMTKQDGNGDVAMTNDAPLSWASAPVDILEGNEEYLVFADVPGVKRDDINIEYAGGELRLHAKREVTDSEVWPAEYRRSFTVGREVDVDRITAELENGVLQVHLPKMESAKPRKIAIQAA